MKGVAPRILSLAALTVLVAPTGTNAAVVVPGLAPNYTFPDGTPGFSLATSGGVLNPGILVGFNPQPDPPGSPLPSLDLANLRSPEFINSADGSVFQFEMAFVGPGFADGLLLPAVQAPNTDGRTSVQFMCDGSVLPACDGSVFVATLEFSGKSSITSWAAFTPSSPPPGNFGAYSIGFGDASVTIQLTDNGVPLAFSMVPEPSTWALMCAGFASLGAFAVWSRRRPQQAA